MRHVLEAVLAIPAGIGLWYLLLSNPKTKRQYLLAGAVVAYVALYWLTFLKH